jgi:hypothetical protein
MIDWSSNDVGTFGGERRSLNHHEFRATTLWHGQQDGICENDRWD